MADFNRLIIMVIVLLLLFGLIFVVKAVQSFLKNYFHPKSALDKAEIKLIEKKLTNASLNDKLIMLQCLFGSCYVNLKLENDSIELLSVTPYESMPAPADDLAHVG